MGNKRGFGLYASTADNDWPSLLALEPAAIVAIDPYHLPRALGPSCYWLWRPWMPGTMREHTPREWFERVYAEWNAKGRHPFNGLQFLNEPNLAAESGYPQGSREAAEAANTWAGALIPLLRQAWPGIDVHSPPLSPNVPGWQDFAHWLAPTIRFRCDVLNVHTYLDQPRTYEEIHGLYPGMPVVISECGDRSNGTIEYACRLQDWFSTLPQYVEWAAVFVYQDTGGMFTEWELARTPAERMLIIEGPRWGI